jgi:hypothetical protein
VAVQFRAETLATIRRRVGYITQREKFLYATVAAVPDSTHFTLNEAKIKQNGSFAGRIAYVVSGTGSGQSNQLVGNVAGVCQTLTSWAVALDTTSVIEIWPSAYGPAEVNNAINEAINDAQDQAIVKAVQNNPTLDATRKIITPPATFSKVVALTWTDSSGCWYRARAWNFVNELKLLESDQWGFAIQGGNLYLNRAISSSIVGTDINLVGYRLPNLLTADTDTAEVRSDYLTYKAAVLLESASVANPQFDPEGAAQRANVWLREVARCYPGLNTELEPNTADLS